MQTQVTPALLPRSWQPRLGRTCHEDTSFSLKPPGPAVVQTTIQGLRHRGAAGAPRLLCVREAPESFECWAEGFPVSVIRFEVQVAGVSLGAPVFSPLCAQRPAQPGTVGNVYRYLCPVSGFPTFSRNLRF